MDNYLLAALFRHAQTRNQLHLPKAGTNNQQPTTKSQMPPTLRDLFPNPNRQQDRMTSANSQYSVAVGSNQLKVKSSKDRRPLDRKTARH